MDVRAETVQALFSAYREDQDVLEMIEHALETFESYHKSIYDMEIKRRMYSAGAMDAETYRELIPRLDRKRTVTHNALLAEVNILNRLAAGAGLEPFYDGVVSEERPYRREVANAVLLYVRRIIEERI